MYGLMHEVIYLAFTGLTTTRPHGEERKLYYVHTHRSTAYTHIHIIVLLFISYVEFVTRILHEQLKKFMVSNRYPNFTNK